MIFNILDRTRQTIVYRTGLLIYTEHGGKKSLLLVVVVAPPLVGGVLPAFNSSKVRHNLSPLFLYVSKNVHTGYSFGM